MIVFPNAKINLGLHIVRRRADGFHDIETVFYPVPLRDALEVAHSRGDEPGARLTVYGLAVTGRPEDNLCVKAWQLLKKDFPTLPAVDAWLLKAIPMGGGLGGGSADGAFMLRLLNTTFNLGISDDGLAGYAAQLGSDCAFFIHNQPCYAEGRGEILSPLALDLSAYRLVLANPGIHVNTGWAFTQLNPAVYTLARPRVRESIALPVAQWRQQLTIDFEALVFERYPAIGELRDMLYREGAVYAAMSGSGSTVYGLFNKKQPLPAPVTTGYRVMNL